MAMRTATKSIDLISKENKIICTCSTLFCTFFLPLFCGTKMLFCTTKTWNFLVTYYFFMKELSYCMCSPKIVACVPGHFLFFFTAAHFHLAGGSVLATSISHFLTAAMKFSCFSSNKICLRCFWSLALALSLLSTWV